MSERISDAVIDQNMDQAKGEAATNPPDNQSPAEAGALAPGVVKPESDPLTRQCPNCGYVVTFAQ